MQWDLLYITFIDMKGSVNSGSGKRPKRMLEAFQEMGLRIKLLDGWNNQYKLRYRNVKKVIKWLETNTPSMCYVEPPSGPFFCTLDLKLLKILHKKKIPIGLFYRDCYWMFPETVNWKHSLKNEFKKIVIRYMQKRDLQVFQETCKYLYYPSASMAEIMQARVDWMALPPGCEKHKIDSFFKKDCERICNCKQLTYFYVGAASKQYGTEILLNSFSMINKKGIYVKLIFVCPEEQWILFENKEKYKKEKWLEVYHLSDDKELEDLYQKSDICVIPRPKNIYNDFAVPIKLYEYLSYFKPILATDCEETKKFVENNHIGWVVKDSEESLVKKMLELNEKREEILTTKKNCLSVSKENLWIKRAHAVVESLSR